MGSKVRRLFSAGKAGIELAGELTSTFPRIPLESDREAIGTMRHRSRPAADDRQKTSASRAVAFSPAPSTSFRRLPNQGMMPGDFPQRFMIFPHKIPLYFPQSHWHRYPQEPGHGQDQSSPPTGQTF
jgi:hypothetical protein